MKKLKVKLTFESPVSTPLQSDTVFGEFCWHFRFLYGEDKLKSILSDGPAVVFSDGFPDGYLPMPIYPFTRSLRGVDRWCEAQETYKEMKQFKKVAYVKKEFLEELLSRYPIGTAMEKLFKEFSSLSEEERSEKFPGKIFEKLTLTRVSIDRRNGKAKKGNLFQERSFYYCLPVSLYVLFDESRVSLDEIGEVFTFLGISGYGSKKSVGKGKFKCELEEWDIKDVNAQRAAFVSLSTGLPKEEEISGFYAEFFTKFPKHGREFGHRAVFKNPVVLSKSGSVFIPEERKEFYGKFERLSLENEHVHSLYIIPFFVELGE